MPTSYKVLGQTGSGSNYGNGSQALTANTNTNLYTVPSSTQTVVSSIVVTNQSTTPQTFRIAIRPDGATIANNHYIAYDCDIYANDSVYITSGITIDASDIITVYASTASMSFSAFGSEIT